MGTPALMASEEAIRREIANNFGGFELEGSLGPENGKQSTGRPRQYSKSNESAAAAAQKKKKKKKQPQRGMGVAQLERLRLQERWKKITQINTTNHPLLQQTPILPNHYFLPPPPFPDPAPPESFTAPSSLNPASLLLERLGNGGYSGEAGGSVFGAGGFSGQFRVDPYGLGATRAEELSSMPNVRSTYSDGQCGRCHKKKRVNGENLMCNGMRGKYADLSRINGCGLLGSNLGNKLDGISKEDHQVFGMRECSHAGGGNADQVRIRSLKHLLNFRDEEVGVQRKGSSISGRVLNEYEFFPAEKGGSRRGTSFEELSLGFSSQASVAVLGGDQGSSCAITTRDSTGFENSVDLSLKLSY